MSTKGTHSPVANVFFGAVRVKELGGALSDKGVILGDEQSESRGAT